MIACKQRETCREGVVLSASAIDIPEGSSQRGIQLSRPRRGAIARLGFDPRPCHRSHADSLVYCRRTAVVLSIDEMEPKAVFPLESALDSAMGRDTGPDE